MKAFKKYGEDAFKFEILIICFNEDVFRFENDYIKKYNSLSPNGYNIAEGGKTNKSFLGKTHSEETRKVLSQKAIEYNSKPEVRERARQTAIEFNKTHNIGDLLRKSEKWQTAIKEGRIGGNSSTEETKIKISEGLKRYHKNNQVDNQQNGKKNNKLSAVMTKAIGRKISQYSKGGEFIESFISITSAQEKTGITRRNISNTLTGHSKSAGGFFWKYDDIPIIEKV